jgi:hypothetical protein
LSPGAGQPDHTGRRRTSGGDPAAVTQIDVRDSLTLAGLLSFAKFRPVAKWLICRL